MNIEMDEKYIRILQQEKGFIQYIRLLAELKNSTIVLAVKDTIGFSVQSDGYAVLSLLGLSKLDSKNKMSNHWKGYIAVIENGKLLFEEIGGVHWPVWFKGNVNGLDLDVVSAPLHGGNTASIWINDKEYSVDTRGLNIVVVSVDGNVRDSVAFDTHNIQRICTRMSEYEEGSIVFSRPKNNLFNRNLKDAIKRLSVNYITQGWNKIEHDTRKIKVRVFFWGWYVLWTAIETLVEAFEEDSRFDVLVIMESNHERTWKIVSERCNAVISKDKYNMKEDCPDIIIYNSPVFSPKKLESTVLSAYVSAGLNDGGIIDYGTNRWKELVEKRMDADLYITEKHQANRTNWYGFGNPKFDIIYRNLNFQCKIPKSWEKLREKHVILWAPDHKWAQKDITFDLYIRPFLDYFQSNTDMGLIIRMHPSYLSELIGSRVWNEDDIHRLKKYCNSFSNIIWDDRKDYGLAYSMADAVITDVNCGITISAMPLNVPIAVAFRYDGEICQPNYPELMEAIYQIHNVDEAYRFFQDVKDGKDALKENRNKIVEKYVANFDGENGNRIKKFIEEKYFIRILPE